MKTLIIYDSLFGNTEKIANAISEAIPSSNLRGLKDARLEDLQSANLLIVGSPTQGGRPTTDLIEFFNNIPNGYLKNINAAVFDTRFEEKEQNIALKILMKTIGYAAPKIADALKEKGAKIITPPIGFIVSKKEGPLKEIEIKYASDWAKNLL